MAHHQQPEADPPAQTARTPPPAETVRVSVAAAAGLTTSIVANGHALSADEPRTVPGGHDSGPSPYGLLLASLGACTAMTLRLYAERKGWPLEAVRVDLWHDRTHARDCQECESESGVIDRIDLSLELDGPLDPEQRARLFEIAGRCPVHRTLTSETRIVIRPDGGSP
jgi:putative redox protein